jgi:hypothetical protein
MSDASQSSAGGLVPQWFRPVLVPSLAVVVVGLLVWATGDVSGLKYTEDTSSKVLDLLGTLLIIALFVERAQEVFVGTWRSLHRARIVAEIDRLDDRIADPLTSDDAARKEELRETKREAETRLQEYRYETRRQAMILGLILGIAISLVSPTVLSVAFFDDVSTLTATLSGFQVVVFRIVDIVLTGMLIGGGSEAIHKVMTVIMDFAGRLRKAANG